MATTAISTDNRLQHIIDFDACKRVVNKSKQEFKTLIVLVPHFSINVQSKYEDGEQLQEDWIELENYIGESLEVNDYDDLVVDLSDKE